jgi:hypothetical protein
MKAILSSESLVTLVTREGIIWWSHQLDGLNVSFEDGNYPGRVQGLLTWVLAVPSLRLLVAGFPPRRPGFEPGSGHVGFVVDKVALGQVFSEYFGFPCQFTFYRLLHNHHHHHLGLVQ